MKTFVQSAIIAMLLGASSAYAQTPNPSPGQTYRQPTPTQPSIAVVSLSEPDRGGAPTDGDLWRESKTLVVNGKSDVMLTKQRIANTPIPDSVESRRKFGGPDSDAGKRTAPRPGPVDHRG